MEEKIAELRRLTGEAEDVDREVAQELRKAKAEIEARRDERAAELFARAQEIQREHSALCSQMRELSSAT